MEAFIIETARPNHRLLHCATTPPEIPDVETLVFMRELARDGLETVIQELDHPIVGHIQHQLGILSLDPTIALTKLKGGDYVRY